MKKQITYKNIIDSDGCIALTKKGNFLYTAGGDNLSIYDIHQAGTPKLMQKISGFGNGRQMTVEGNILYITAREFGLWILDISEPAAPKIITRFDTVELATGVAANGNLVFVTLRTFGVEIIDCSDPCKPRHLSLTPTPEAQSIAYSNGLLYVGDWRESCVTVLDIVDPIAPVKLSKAPLGGFGDGVAIDDGICYAATGLNARGGAEGHELGGDGHGLDIFRIDGKNPLKHLSRISFPKLDVKSNDFWTVKVSTKTAFIADTHNGVFQVDVSDPCKPRCAARIELPEISCVDNRPEGRVAMQVPDCVGDIAIGDKVLYIAGQETGLHVAKIAEASPETENTKKFKWNSSYKKKKNTAISAFSCYEIDGQVRRLALVGDIIYAACSHAGIQILLLNNNKIEEVGKISIPCSYDVKVRDGKLYSAEGLDGLAIYSINGSSLKEIGRWKDNKTIIQLLHISANCRFASCGSRDGILRIFNISESSAIDYVFHDLHGGLMYGDTFPEQDFNNIMPMLWPHCGVAWYDLSGEKPKVLRDDRTKLSSGQHEGITCFNGNFLLNTTYKKFILMSPNDLGEKAKYYSSVNAGCSGIPSVNDEYIAFSHKQKREINFYHFSPSGTVTRIKERCINSLYGTPDRIVFHKGKMLIPCGYQGLLIEKMPLHLN
jgi:hypothetical protein